LDKVTGEELRRFGSVGSEEGQLYMPTNLALDQEGNVYVTDTGNARILVFDNQGQYVRQISARGLAVGLLARPKGLAVDREGRVFVVDSAFENVQIFGPDGKLLLFFGLPGDGRGNINLPTQVVIDYDNVALFKDRFAPGHEVEYIVLVTSQFGRNKVNVYGFLKNDETENGPAPVEN
jgi:DNA-binding beta-propeller fold protein YncE